MNKEYEQPQEVDMNSLGRRDFLKSISFLGVAVGFKKTTLYDPGAKFDLNVSEVEYRRTKAGRPLMARIYQPVGAGPFPTDVPVERVLIKSASVVSN